MRILFYARRNLHIPHLEPIRAWIAQNCPEAEDVYSSPAYTPAKDGIAGAGLSENQITELQNQGAAWISREKIAAFNPDVTVTADADFYGMDWNGKIVNVNHGLICKGTFYTSGDMIHRENRADLICVPGEYHREILQNIVQPPVITTGLVKFDPIGKGELNRESARDAFGFNMSDRVVLFAPTYNLELSAVPVLTERIRELAADGTRLLIKLHGMSPPAWSELYGLIALLEENIRFVPDQDITPCLVAADVVVSDVSSAFMEAIALDRPVVLVNNPLQRFFHHYDPDDIEYRWRDVGIEVDTPEETVKAVQRCFEYPEEKAALRRLYGSRLVGTIDGKAAQRAGEAIIRIVSHVNSNKLS